MSRVPFELLDDSPDVAGDGSGLIKGSAPTFLIGSALCDQPHEVQPSMNELVRHGRTLLVVESEGQCLVNRLLRGLRVLARGRCSFGDFSPTRNCRYRVVRRI
jgi:hypothetical protein